MASAPYILQPPTRLSGSLLWSLQRESYCAQGPRAWRPGGVPLQIVSNPLIAQACAEVIHAFLHDLACAGADLTRPVFVLELGAGSGRFGHHLALALRALCQEVPLPVVPFQVVLSDLVESNRTAWATHPRLRPLIDEGLIDTAHFDSEGSGDIVTAIGGVALSSSPHPTVAIANYFFDSIPSDAFQIKQGNLLAYRVGLMLPDESAAELSPGARLAALSWWGEAAPLSGPPYGEPHRDRILADYAAQLDQTVLLFPEGGLRCLDRLSALSGGLLLLSNDKGQGTLDSLAGQTHIPLARHGGTLSLSVNYDAIRRYVCGLGGHHCQSPHADGSLVSSLSLLGLPPERAPHTLLAFRRRFMGFNASDYQRLRNGMLAQEGTPTPDVVLGLLRLSRYDPVVLVRFKGALLEQRGLLRGRLLDELRAALALVWENRFPLAGESLDVAFEIASLLQAADHPAEALVYYARSLEEHGEHFATRFNQALCHIALGQLDEALTAAGEAVTMQPESTEARAMWTQLHTARSPEGGSEPGRAG